MRNLLLFPLLLLAFEANAQISSNSNIASWPIRELCLYQNHPTEGSRVRSEISKRGESCQPGGSSVNPQVGGAQAFRNQQAAINNRIKEECENPKYKLFFNKTACRATDINLEHLADNSRATPQEKKIIAEMDVLFNETSQMFIKNYKENGPNQDFAHAMSRILESSRLKSQMNLMGLYTGKITWGTYNTTRKEIYFESKDKADQVVKEYRDTANQNRERQIQRDEARLREKRIEQQSDLAKQQLESRCNSLRLSAMGQTKSRYWYDSVNAGADAYDRCMMGLPPVERPKPTTTDCQRIGPDNITCTTK